MTDKSAAAKLRLKPGHAIYAINAPEGYADLLGGLPSLARLVDSAEQPAEEPPDVVHLFVRDLAQLETELPKALATVPDPAKNLFWVSYPRTGSDLNRAVVWRELVKHGWRPVSGIAIDDTWAAMRGRP